MRVSSCRLVFALSALLLASATSVGTAAARPVADERSAPAGATLVCGQPVLRSPYHYNGVPGPYASGTKGLPTYGTPDADFPRASAGQVLPPETRNYPSYELNPDTVYYLLPGQHVGSFQADANDAFVGGSANGVRSVLTGNYTSGPNAIDSNSTIGNQPGVTIEYLVIEEFTPNVNAGAINQDTNTGWTIQYNTITLNVPGAGIMAGADNTIRSNCLTKNGQYGFQSTAVDSWGRDSLTDGPYNVTVTGNEISHNDTCDLEGKITNVAAGWRNRNPVPPAYRNAQCGQVSGDGNQGGFKLWHTNGVTIANNYLHHNYGPAAWVDSDNANTTISGNTITDNDGQAVFEEISYNFAITNNYLARNAWVGGLSNPAFPEVAIYISESGSDTRFGGVPACAEPSCADQPSYPTQSLIENNTLVDNGGGIFLWQNSNRYCSSGIDGACTLVHGTSGPFTIAGCAANLPAASVDTSDYVGTLTGTPTEDWWDGCMWKTENVSITDNEIDFDPSHVQHCTQSAWPACGANGIFSEYGGPNDEPGWVIPTSITFFQHNQWSNNVYNGPSVFVAWNQGNGDNPVSWAAWTGDLTDGDLCSSSAERQSGYCTGPFGQDTGSSYTGQE